jgi:hypothetical protein
MRFSEIEAQLGREATFRIQDSVNSAYRAAGARRDGVNALRQLLVSMLASVVTTERHMPMAEYLAAEDAAQLNALVRLIKDMKECGASVIRVPPADRAASDVGGTPSQGPCATFGLGARRCALVTARRAVHARNGYATRRQLALSARHDKRKRRPAQVGDSD